MSFLAQHGRECTEPPVDDIRSVGVFADSAARTGFVVTLVKHSDGGPYRAALGPKEVKDKYYLRHSDETHVMTHGELDLMFGRPPRPILIPAITLQDVTRGDNERLGIAWDLWNKGRGMAVGAVLEVRGRSYWSTGCPIPYDASWPVPLKEFDWVAYTARKADARVSDSDEGDYHLFEAYIPFGGRSIRAEDGHIRVLRMDMNWDLLVACRTQRGNGHIVLDWVTGAQNMRPQRGSFFVVITERTVLLIEYNIVEEKKPLTKMGIPGEAVEVYYAGPNASE